MTDNELGRNIINSNQYMSLATCHYNDVWISPVSYVTDENYNFYFVSHARSKHVIQSILNNTVAISIFDSTQKEGEGNGVQIKGTSSQLPKGKYGDVIRLFIEKKRRDKSIDFEDKSIDFEDKSIDETKLIEKKIEEYSLNDRVIFQVIPTEVYIQERGHFEKYKVDKRIQIELNK